MRNCVIILVLMLSSSLIYAQSDLKSSDPVASPSQAYSLNSANSKFIIKGTSSLHDWEMVSDDCTGSIRMDATSETLAISDIKVKLQVKSLKSGKKIMDNKTYDALKEDKFPTITYQYEKIGALKETGPNTYSVTLNGTLTIAGKSKKVPIDVLINQTNKSITIKGEKPLKMTDFGVEPPTALLGTIKTGDDITIDFNLNYN